MVDLRRERTGLRPEPTLDDVRGLTDRFAENDALADWRRQALARYQEAGLPYKGAHLWKYTPIESLFPRTALVSSEARSPAPAPSLTPGGATAVLQADRAPAVTLSDAALQSGVKLVDLRHADGLLSRLGETVGPDHGLLEALNGALWSSGVAVYVPRGVVVPDPIHVRVVADNRATLPRVLVVAEANAEATVFEEHMGGGEGGSVVAVSEVVAGQAAHVRHVIVQRWGGDLRGHLTVRSHVGRDASVQTVLASLGGEVAKLDLGGVLTAPGARSELIGVVLADQGQHMDHHTVHDHRAPHTWSNIDLKVAVAGESRSAYTGLIRIAEDAASSEAYQENRNLVMSEAANAETIPELEILTDDVMCTHGATVAPVDREQLFYLESRGIPTRAAIELVLTGFLEKTLSRIPDRLRGGLEPLVAERLARVANASVPAAA